MQCRTSAPRARRPIPPMSANGLGRGPRQDSAGHVARRPRQGVGYVLLDRRARQVPHPRREGCAGRDRDLHQPSWHVRGLCQRRPVGDPLAAAAGRPRTRGGDAAPVDGPLRHGRGAGQDPPGRLGSQGQDAFDRAWRRVGLALDRVGFTVEDRDRSQGLYFVRYVDPEVDARKKDKDEGFLAKLAFWRSSKPDPAKSQRYRVLVKGAGESSYVQIMNADGVAETSETGGKILRLLLEQLK